MSDVSGLLSLYNLLAQASNVSCLKGANAFLSFLTSEDVSLSFAINGFIPALQNQNFQIPQRILAAFVLHALYASHDHSNPFHDHLLHVFESERAIALAASRTKSSLVDLSQRGPESQNMQAENEQLVWVLWKILQREGDDLAPYSPNLLSRTTIPEHLRPLHLNVEGASGHDNGTHFNTRNSSPDFPQPSLGYIDPQISTTFFQTRSPSSLSGPSRTPSAPRLSLNRRPSTSEFLPSDGPFPESSGLYRQKASEVESQVNRSLQQSVSMESLKRNSYPHSPDPQGVTYGYTSSPGFSDPTSSKAQADSSSIPETSHNRYSKVIGDQRQQTLPQGMLQGSYLQSHRDSLIGGIAGIYNRPDRNNLTGTSTKMVNESSRTEQQLQQSTAVLPHASTESNVQQGPVQSYLMHPSITSENASSLNSVAFDTRPNTRPRLDQILRPRSRAPSSQSAAALFSPAARPTPAVEIFSVDGRLSRPDVTSSYGHELPQQSLMQMNNNTQQTPRIPFAYQGRTSTPTRVSPPIRSPGVIGSGRPSGSISKNDTPVHHNTVASRWSQIGIIGNERPDFSMTVRDSLPANRGTNAGREHEGMIPFSVLRMRSMKEESEKIEHSIIGQPETDLGDDNGRKRNELTEGETSLLEKLTALSIERRAQETYPKADIASFTMAAQYRNSSPSQAKAEFIPPHPLSVPVQRPGTLLDANATAFYPQPVSSPVSAMGQIKNKATRVSPLRSSSPMSSVPTTENGQLYQSSEPSQPAPFYTSRREETSESHINEKERDELSHAIFLLLSARERVLTLTEQRMLQPHLSTLTQPLSLLRPGDIPPLVAKNTGIAAKLLLLLLDRKEEDAERIERILRDLSKNGLSNMSHGPLDDARPLPATTSIDSMAAVDAIQALVRFVGNGGAPSNPVGLNDISPFGGREAKEGYLDAIRRLPPTMQSFNLIAQLLRPTHHRAATSEQQEDSAEVRVAILIRTEVLGVFLSGCVRWIEHVEQEEREGEIHDDRVAIAIASLCRFYSSLLKHGFVSAASEADTIEMMRFSLQFSRYEEARSLYSTLAAART